MNEPTTHNLNFQLLDRDEWAQLAQLSAHFPHWNWGVNLKLATPINNLVYSQVEVVKIDRDEV